LCTPRVPACHLCPVCDLCQAYARGEQALLPRRRPHRKIPHYDVAAAVLVRDDGCVLVTQRHAEDMLGGLWEFPGGKREDGETLQECLAREMREELGIEIAADELLSVVEHAYSHFRITLYAFCCRLISGTPRCLDCAALRWATPAELDTLPMSVADRKIARALQARQC
ncbi:MAG: (deoxy)nucleoside triphosphate pyrophosphohydrolase, partial [Anaerolineae bacterium]|nr:(deoxy)nucleoside triphosphate pyrophosphohydrolase [Anaerolineae bacterium]